MEGMVVTLKARPARLSLLTPDFWPLTSDA